MRQPIKIVDFSMLCRLQIGRVGTYTCNFNWIRYYPDCGINGSIGSNGNATAHLKIMIIFHPAPKVSPSGGDNFTVVVCSKVHDKQAPWFREFIQYQKTLGVDHIDFSVLESYI